MKSKLAVLGERGWLSLTPPSFRQSVLDRLTLHSFPAGSPIFRAGDPPGGLWALVDGAVQVELVGTEPTSCLAHVATPGFWLGEGPLIFTTPRRVGVHTTRSSTLAELSLADGHQLLQEFPAFWRWIALLAAINSDLAIGLAADLLLQDPRRRIVATLLRLGGCRMGPYLPPAPEPVSIGQQELSKIANLSRTVVSGALRDIEKQNLIRIQYRRISILDVPALRSMLAGK